MLFQMCYGPELEAIHMVVCRQPGITMIELTDLFQYNPDGDITSLIEGAITFLKEVDFLAVEEKRIYPRQNGWDVITLLKRLNEIMKNEKEPSFNYLFSTMYYELFIKPDRLYVQDIYYETNAVFVSQPVGQEKVNAWKRIMEFLGLGYRAYGGFYALPHPTLLLKIIASQKGWEGPAQIFCQEHVSTIIPCEYKGKVYQGILHGLQGLHSNGIIKLQYKQDLPYVHYDGMHGRWNWLQIKEDVSCYLV
ncbi:hypothetical protein [Bacillus sp. 165]|uniref:hypothetical protein n=1 Tax=Bacillus sp. 165 TaxID=1529117 RepID=UPI001ADAF76A|nr:hypothetical protein [Bacillus sp. 165]MBO9128585.1 hypothetical protein [Bacillus sp. 165]